MSNNADYLFLLSEKHKPGTDLISKLVLMKPEIANIFVSKLIGETARDKYMAVPTEWPNLMKSDIVYEPISKKDRQFPPILVEIQHTVDIKFYRRINEYCLQMLKRYPVLPIVVVIVINATTQDVLDLMESNNPDIAFASQLPCTCWAKSFHLLNAGTIRPYLAEPLDPLVAIAHFLIEQKQSLISMELREDATIQMLYKFAKELFEGDIAKYENTVDTLQNVCIQTRQQFVKARNVLVEDVESTNARKRTTKALDDGVLFVDQICKKHCLSVDPSTTATTSSSAPSSSALIPAPVSALIPAPVSALVSSPGSALVPAPTSTNHDVLPTPQHENPTWSFVDAWRKQSGNAMDWNACFNIGKDIGLFKKYKSQSTAKSAYFRSKSHAK